MVYFLRIVWQNSGSIKLSDWRPMKTSSTVDVMVTMCLEHTVVGYRHLIRSCSLHQFAAVCLSESRSTVMKQCSSLIIFTAAAVHRSAGMLRTCDVWSIIYTHANLLSVQITWFVIAR